jgi:hypothetical protein
MHTGFWWGNLNRKKPLANPMHKWKIILILIFKKYDWVLWKRLLIAEAQDRNRRRAVVNEVISSRVS